MTRRSRSLSLASAGRSHSTRSTAPYPSFSSGRPSPRDRSEPVELAASRRTAAQSLRATSASGRRPPPPLPTRPPAPRPREKAEAKVASTPPLPPIWSDRRIPGTTHEKASGTIPTDLKSLAMPANEATAKTQLGHFGSPGTGKWTKREKDASTADVELSAEFKLSDDGRRSGTLRIKVLENSDVAGFYYSDKDGQKYEVTGKVSNTPAHQITFRVTYQRTTQALHGHLFPGPCLCTAGLDRV